MAVKCKPSQYHCFRSSSGPDSKWHETEQIIKCSRKQYERQVYFTLLFLLHLLSPGLRSPATSYSCSYYWPSHLPSLFFLPGVEASAYACPDLCRATSKGFFPSGSGPGVPPRSGEVAAAPPLLPPHMDRSIPPRSHLPSLLPHHRAACRFRKTILPPSPQRCNSKHLKQALVHIEQLKIRKWKSTF